MLDRAREEMAPVDRIRDLESRVKALETPKAAAPELAGGARPVDEPQTAAASGYPKLDPPAGA